MHREVRSSLTRALTAAVRITEQPVAESLGEFGVWRRTGPGSFEGVTVQRPRLEFVIHGALLGNTLKGFASDFSQHYAESTTQIGFSGMRMALAPENVFCSMVEALWERSWPTTPKKADIDVIVTEFSEFLDNSTVTVSYYAPLRNFDMPEGLGPLSLPTGTKIKQLDNDELAMLTGVWGEPRMMLQIYEFAFVGEFEVEKKYGPLAAGEPAIVDIPWRAIRRTLIGMKCFKPGGIDFASLRLLTRKFVPLHFASEGRFDRTPLPLYRLTTDEVEPLCEHLKHFREKSHPSLELAYSRLAQAEGRRDDVDKLLDAVIGLEAVLLFKSEQELSYRFALNYSTLFNSQEQRLRAFQEARHVYKARSRVSHGLDLKQDTVQSAASTACEMLRTVTKTFLPAGKNPPYLAKEYWATAIFGDLKRSERASMPIEDVEDEGLDEYWRAVNQYARYDVQWAKEQQWRISHYCLLLYAGFVASSRVVDESWWSLLTVLVALTGFCASALVALLQRSANNARTRGEAAVSKFPSEIQALLPIGKDNAGNDVAMATIVYAILVGAVVSIGMILRQ